jgi:beta-N-acetylhexosaminidase
LRRSGTTLGAVVALAIATGLLVASVLPNPSATAPPGASPSGGTSASAGASGSTPPGGSGSTSARPSAAGSAAPSSRPTPAPAPGGATLGQRIGQRLIVAMAGRTPSAALLGRARRGEIGGVVLFRRNVSTPAALHAAIASLQQAAREGGQPPLLVMVDQEGGAIRTIPWAPPALTAAAMGEHTTAWIQRQGASTGDALAAVGINVDLAPVADVAVAPRGFMAIAGRAFSPRASVVAGDVVAFAAGLRAHGVIAVGKHAPGIGRVALNTDQHMQTVAASASALGTDLGPFRSLIRARIPMLMLSNATYAAYDPVNAAGWSRAISVDLLRTSLGFTGVTITDSLDGTAHSRGVSEASLALKAALAGTDLLLLTGSEETTAATFRTLVAAAGSGALPPADLDASHARILALKASLGS